MVTAGGTALPEPPRPAWPEWKVRAVAVPVALVVAVLVNWSATGHSMVRIALAMPLHEGGHAITSWWCGYSAIPTFWKTLIGQDRATFVTVAVAVGLAVIAWRGWVTDRVWLVGAAVAAGALCFLATTADADWAQALITFGGDAGALVLAIALMLAFCVAGPESKLRAGGLRWGLLAIGACVFVTTAALWWHARTDPTVIPYGEIEGVGQSDPTKLLEVFDWMEPQIIGRYATLIEACVVVLALGWGASIWAATRLGVRHRSSDEDDTSGQ